MATKININQIECPTEKVKVSFREAGRRGGLAKVPKGFAKMDKEQLRELSRKASAKRWAGHEKE